MFYIEIHISKIISFIFSNLLTWENEMHNLYITYILVNTVYLIPPNPSNFKVIKMKCFMCKVSNLVRTPSLMHMQLSPGAIGFPILENHFSRSVFLELASSQYGWSTHYWFWWIAQISTGNIWSFFHSSLD